MEMGPQPGEPWFILVSTYVVLPSITEHEYAPNRLLDALLQPLVLL